MTQHNDKVQPLTGNHGELTGDERQTEATALSTSLNGGVWQSDRSPNYTCSGPTNSHHKVGARFTIRRLLLTSATPGRDSWSLNCASQVSHSTRRGTCQVTEVSGVVEVVVAVVAAVTGSLSQSCDFPAAAATIDKP